MILKQFQYQIDLLDLILIFAYFNFIYYDPIDFENEYIHIYESILYDIYLGQKYYFQILIDSKIV